MSNNKKEKQHLDISVFSQFRTELMGIAALMIIIFHSNGHSTWKYSKYFSDFNIGVEIFFFLSGLGLYYSFAKKDKSSNGTLKYIYKRLINIWVPAIVSTLIVQLTQGFIDNKFNFSFIIKHIFGLDYWFSSSQALWYIWWALLFYLIYPIYRVILKHCAKNNKDYLLTVILCIVTAFLSIFLNFYAYDFWQCIETGFTRIPIFLIGCYCGRLAYEKKQFTSRWHIYSIFGILIWAIWRFRKIWFQLLGNSFPFKDKIDIFLASLPANRLSHCLFTMAALYVLAFILFKIHSSFLNSVLKFFGNMSLEMYLYHLGIIGIFKKILNVSKVSPSLYLFCTLITIIIGYSMYRLRVFLVKKLR